MDMATEEIKNRALEFWRIVAEGYKDGISNPITKASLWEGYGFERQELEEIFLMLINGIELDGKIFKFEKRIANGKEEYFPIVEEKQLEPKLEVEVSGIKYQLFKDDGISVSHAGWFIPTDEKMSCAELFYAFSKIKTSENEYESIEPYLLIFEYDKTGNVIKREFQPLKAINVIELGNAIAKIEKKTIGESALPTQIKLDTVVYLLNNRTLNLDLKELFERVKRKVLNYVGFKEETHADIVSLWIIGTYFSDVFGVYPNLFILGPSGSGKTRLTSLIVYGSRRGLMITDPTDANLPRIIDGYRPTLGLDDFDFLMRKHFPVVMSILKHVYKVSVQIPRLEKVSKGNRFILSLFKPYCPLVMNSTEPLEDTQLITRLIEIDLEKEKRKFPKRDPDVYYFDRERQELYIARFILAPKVYQIFATIDTGLVGRDDEIWSPILTIAKLIDEQLYSKIKEYAIKRTSEREVELYYEEKLIIRAIEKVIDTNAQQQLNSQLLIQFTASDLRDKLKEILVDEEKELTEKDFEKRWTPEKIGRILERLHIPVKRTDKQGKRVRFLTIDELNKLKQTFGLIGDKISDSTDSTDSDLGISKETEVSKIKDLSQINGVYETSKIYTYTKLPSELSELSETRDKNEIVGKFSKIEQDVIDTIKNPPIGRRIYKFELISFLEQREYKQEDIEKTLNKLIKEGIVILYPDETLEINFSKLMGGG
jgi:hypothetical protein